MQEVFFDSLVDSVKVFFVLLLFHYLLSYFEGKVSKLLTKRKYSSPFFGALIGLVPQCGISVVASDLYLKERLTQGTLLAVFLACSDEAFPILLSHPETLPDSFLLLAIKFVIGFLAGFLLDFSRRKKEIKVPSKEIVEEIHHGCCHHEIDNEHESDWKKHLYHPLEHSFKITLYVFVFTFLFGVLLYLVGEENVWAFFEQSRYLSPLFALLLGMIPNCASSVLLSEMFVSSHISFGALLTGLMMNAGLGMVLLWKDKKKWKKHFYFFLLCAVISLITGYVTCLIMGF